MRPVRRALRPSSSPRGAPVAVRDPRHDFRVSSSPICRSLGGDTAGRRLRRTAAPAFTGHAVPRHTAHPRGSPELGPNSGTNSGHPSGHGGKRHGPALAGHHPRGQPPTLPGVTARGRHRSAAARPLARVPAAAGAGGPNQSARGLTAPGPPRTTLGPNGCLHSRSHVPLTCDATWRTGPRSTESPAGAGLSRGGRYWARTSDLRLVEAALSQLS
jgi:hypothetical protein